MRLREVLPELLPQAWQRWIELAPSVPPNDPLPLLDYPGPIERAAKAGNRAAVAMLDLLDDMLRGLVVAGIHGRIIAVGLIRGEERRLGSSHWQFLEALAAEELRHAIVIGRNRIRLLGETVWADAIWDDGATKFDVGLPATDVAVIEGMVVSYAASPAPASAELLQASSAPVSEAPLPAIADPKPAHPDLVELLLGPAEEAMPLGRQFDRLVLQTWLASELKYDCAAGAILRAVDTDKRHEGHPLLNLQRTARYDSVKRVRENLLSRKPSA